MPRSFQESQSGVNIVREHAKPKFHGRGEEGRYIAAEIEINSSDPTKAVSINRTLNKWKAAVVHDGSLDGDGYEINTAPAKGAAFDREIRDICRKLRRAKAKVARNCGLHIHVDARDIRYISMRRVLQTYLQVEKDLFSMLAPSRRNNHFCSHVSSVAWVRQLANGEMTAPKFRTELVRLFYGGRDEMEEGKKHKYGGYDRYWALNLQSWFYRGTLEFRAHHGTANPTKIINWGRICESIIDFGLEHTEKEIKKHFTNNPEPLASILNPTLKQYFLERREHFNNRRRNRRR